MSDPRPWSAAARARPSSARPTSNSLAAAATPRKDPSLCAPPRPAPPTSGSASAGPSRTRSCPNTSKYCRMCLGPIRSGRAICSPFPPKAMQTNHFHKSIHVGSLGSHSLPPSLCGTRRRLAESRSPTEDRADAPGWTTLAERPGDLITRATTTAERFASVMIQESSILSRRWLNAQKKRVKAVTPRARSSRSPSKSADCCFAGTN